MSTEIYSTSKYSSFSLIIFEFQVEMLTQVFLQFVSIVMRNTEIPG